ncbi:MAG: TraX family protein [Candidatus Bathyarchaeia archaeon]
MGREILKWIAIATMTIDHIGAIFYSDYTLLRIIGRLAFPIFCYLIILGMKSTRNLKNYCIRLFLFALISQVPFYLAFGLTPFVHLNIFFTLSSGVLLIHFFKKNPLVSLLVVLASTFLNFDFGPYGIALIGCMYILSQDTEHGIISIVLLNVLSLLMWDIQVYSLLALPIILLHKSGFLKMQSRLDRSIAYPLWRKYLFYVYYPAHLAMLYLIKSTF